MANLELKNIAKSYHSFDAIAGLNLEVEDGEFVVIVGPSGCGKSTLLRMIAGLEDITRGDLLIDGVRSNSLPPQRRNIAMVFQTYALFPHLNAEQNITFGMEVRGENKTVANQKLDHAAEILNLKPYLKRKPSELSGGQRQRVAMGRAIVRESGLFLFDEPLSNLDAHLRADMRTEIKSLHQKLGSTIIYVTHDQIEAMTMADRIVIMSNGKIEQVGTPAELYDKPKNKFVGGFLGSPSMCFLDAIVEKPTKDQHASLLDGTMVPIFGRPVTSELVTLGFRPESFEIDPEGPYQMLVEVVEPTGPETMAFGKIADQTVRCVFKGRPELAIGEKINLNVEAQHVHVFDRQSGNRF